VRCEIEELTPGWFQLSLRLKLTEIDVLIRTLEILRQRQDHFHLMSHHNEAQGVADIEISIQGDNEIDNMFGGFAPSDLRD
jgi:hypothetical protein